MSINDSGILVVKIVCGIITAILAAVAICIYLYTLRTGRQCHSIWLWAYATMTAFSLTIISAFVWYIHTTDGPKTATYVFYFIAIILTLIVFIRRLETSLESTVFAYSHKLIYSLYIMIATIPLAVICLFLFTKYNFHVAIFFVVYLLLVIIFLSLTSLYLFIRKLIFLQNVDNAENPQVIQELIELQTKLTVLVIVCVVSTFMFQIIGLIFQAIIAYEFAELLTVLCISIDSFVGLMCIACTLAPNVRIYHIGCAICANCVRSIIICRRDRKGSKESNGSVHITTTSNNTSRTAIDNHSNAKSINVRQDTIQRPVESV